MGKERRKREREGSEEIERGNKGMRGEGIRRERRGGEGKGKREKNGRKEE